MLKLRAYIQMTGTGVAEKDLKPLVEKMNTEAAKTAKPGQKKTQIKNLDVKGNKILLDIEGDAFPRPHDLLMRFRKLLAHELGKKKIGIRNVTAEKYVIETVFDEIKAKEILKGVAEVEKEKITFKKLDQNELRTNFVDRVLKKIAVVEGEEMGEGRWVPLDTVMIKAKKKKMLYHKDPVEEMEELGWIRRYTGRGQWIFAPPMVKLIEAIRDIILNEIAKPDGFAPWMFPRLIPLEVIKKMPAYLDKLPEGMFYVCAPPREPTVFDEFKKKVELKNEIDRDLLKDILENPNYVLEPTQCTNFYAYYEGRKVRAEDLPVKGYEYMGGWTWRNEAGGVEGLAKTNEFLRIEFIYLGTPEQILKIRNYVFEKTVDVVDKILDLEFQVVAGAPFYMGDEEARKNYVNLDDETTIGVKDVECYLPYKGPRDKTKWLEIAAPYIHGTKFVKNFRIKEVKGREIWTGCTGFGVTRWVLAFLAQKGLDPKNWPAGFKKYLGKLPEAPKIVK